MGRCSFFTRIILVSVIAFAGGVGCRVYERNVPSASTAPVLPGQGTGVFTTARPSFGAALNDFMDRRPNPVQPIEFPLGPDFRVPESLVGFETPDCHPGRLGLYEGLAVNNFMAHRIEPII